MSFDDRKPFILLSGKSDILKFAFFQLSEFSESQILFTDQRVNGDNARIFQHFIEIKGLEFILSLFDHSWWFVGILDPLLSNIISTLPNIASLSLLSPSLLRASQTRITK